MVLSFMLRSLFPRAAGVKSVDFGLGFAYQLQRLQGMVGLMQGVEPVTQAVRITGPLHNSSENTGS